MPTCASGCIVENRLSTVQNEMKPGATLSFVSAINPKLFEKMLLNATHKSSLQNIVATHTFNLASLWYVIQFTSH